MATTVSAVDPFAMLLDPQTVLNAMERSSRLGSLRCRVCRPLDRPLIPCTNGEQEEADRAIDAEPDTDE